jgi:hypothetical protein
MYKDGAIQVIKGIFFSSLVSGIGKILPCWLHGTLPLLPFHGLFHPNLPFFGKNNKINTFCNATTGVEYE